MAIENKYIINLNGKDTELTETELLIHIQTLEQNLNIGLSELNSTLTNKISNLAVHFKHLEKRVLFTEWMNDKLKIQKKSSGVKIYQRQIFYCQLGYNIGSEQNGRRPVVIIQNDFGNKSNTTLVAPITTHNGEIKYDGKKYYYMAKDDTGVDIKKYLDYYEIPIELECVYTQQVKGFINIAHLIDIDKKRLEITPVAKITKDNFKNVLNAININFRITS